jgi:hypothetical protein
MGSSSSLFPPDDEKEITLQGAMLDLFACPSNLTELQRRAGAALDAMKALDATGAGETIEREEAIDHSTTQEQG